MHIEKVELYGFKSFGFKNTTLRLEPGLVSLSGANGSGKSSILDAIAFALGEKSARVLQVSRLSDIIHDYDRNPGGVARVSVHFNNTGHSLPVDSERVTFTRVLEGSSGESTYYINNKKATRGRLIDILEVAGATITPLNNIRQGVASRIAEMGAHEKRDLISESIGLSSFDEKKAQVMNELDTADRHLEVVLAKTDNMRSRIGELEVERNDVLRAKTLHRDLERYRTISAQQRLASIQSNISSTQTLLYDTGSELDSATSELDHLRQDIEATERHKQAEQNRMDECNRALSGIRVQLDTARDSYQKAESQLAIDGRRLEDIQDKIPTTQHQILDIIRQRRILRPRLHEAFDRLQEASDIRDDTNRKLLHLEQSRSHMMDRWNNLTAEARKSESAIKRLNDTAHAHERSLLQIYESIKYHRQDIQDGNARLAELAESVEGLTTLRDRLDIYVHRCDTRLKGITNHMDMMQSKRDLLLKRIADLDPLIEKAADAAARHDSRLGLVRRVMHEDYSVGRLRIDAPHLDIMGTVSELFSWPDRYNRAILAARSDWLKALVVPDTDTMRTIHDTIYRMGLPRARVIPLDAISAGRSDTPHPVLSEYISCDKRLEPLRDMLFDVTISDDTTDVESVTLSGRYTCPTGTIIDNGSRMSDLTRIISASTEISTLESGVRKIRDIRNRWSERVSSISDDIDDTTTQHSELSGDIIKARQTLSDVQLRLEEAGRRRDAITTRLADKTRTITEMEKQRAHHQQMLDTDRASLKSINATEQHEEAHRLEIALSRTKEPHERLKMLQAKYTSEHAKIHTIWSDIRTNSHDMLRRANHITKDMRQMYHESQAISSRLPTLQKTLEERRSALAAIREQEQNMMETPNISLQKTKEYESQLGHMRNKERRLADTIKALQRRSDSLERDISNARSEAAAISDSLPSQIYEPPPELDTTHIIKALNEEINSLPTLNAKSTTTYTTTSDGYRAMSDRKNMLEQERNRIISFIESVEQEKRQRFLEAFDTVDTEIRSIFGKMIGGSAWLELDNEDDIFESGITYMVQFPDKSKRASASLSGGEKSLAAIVFVLALQRLDPSPFYLFDELDAALDAPNAKRLADILSERSVDSQFITVSHKDYVVGKANLKYGVYPRNGISCVVDASRILNPLP